MDLKEKFLSRFNLVVKEKRNIFDSWTTDVGTLLDINQKLRDLKNRRIIVEKKMDDILTEKKSIIFNNEKYKNVDQRNAALQKSLLANKNYQIFLTKVGSIDKEFESLTDESLSIDKKNQIYRYQLSCYEAELNFMSSLLNNKMKG